MRTALPQRGKTPQARGFFMLLYREDNYFERATTLKEQLL